jgi:hypothetical protein
MAYVRLSAVAALAIKDPAFFKALQKDAPAALGRANLKLSPADLETLQTNLRAGAQQVKVDVSKLITWAQGRVGGTGASGQALGDPWDVDWGTQWVVPVQPTRQDH